MPPYGFSEDDYEEKQTFQEFYYNIEWIKTINDYFNNKNKKVKKDYKLSNE